MGIRDTSVALSPKQYGHITRYDLLAVANPDDFTQTSDLVYNPPLTQFLDYGRQRGAHILNGRTMFVGQAEASWRIWNA